MLKYKDALDFELIISDTRRLFASKQKRMKLKDWLKEVRDLLDKEGIEYEEVY